MDIPTTELTLFYNGYTGNTRKVLWNIVRRHFKPFRNHNGRTDCGKGVYLHEKPDLAKCRNQGIVICKVLIGNSYRIRKPNNDPAPEGNILHILLGLFYKVHSVLAFLSADSCLAALIVIVRKDTDKEKKEKCTFVKKTKHRSVKAYIVGEAKKEMLKNFVSDF